MQRCRCEIGIKLLFIRQIVGILFFLITIFWFTLRCISHSCVLAVHYCRMWGITQAIYSTACNNDVSVLELNRLWFSLNHGIHSFKRSCFERRWNVRSLKNETCLHPQQKQILTISGLSDWIFFFSLFWQGILVQAVCSLYSERVDGTFMRRWTWTAIFARASARVPWSESKVNKASDERADRPAVADALSARL